MMRANLLGCPVDILTMQETIALARAAMRTRNRMQHVALNVAKLVNMREDAALAADVANSDLIGIDGMGIVFAARCLGIPVKERVAGIDLFLQLLRVCADDGFRPFFLGATAQVLERAVAQAVRDYPGLRIAGCRDGYFGPQEESEVVRQIAATEADCLFIGMPTPRKERFLASYRDRLGVPFIMGVGGSFDILAGKVRRAPASMQIFGLEWLYRIYQEPRRMWWRYARTNVLFASLLVRGLLQHRLFTEKSVAHLK